jgi:hypothetical protein
MTSGRGEKLRGNDVNNLIKRYQSATDPLPFGRENSLGDITENYRERGYKSAALAN